MPGSLSTILTFIRTLSCARFSPFFTPAFIELQLCQSTHAPQYQDKHWVFIAKTKCEYGYSGSPVFAYKRDDYTEFYFYGVVTSSTQTFAFKHNDKEVWEWRISNVKTYQTKAETKQPSTNKPDEYSKAFIKILDDIKAYEKKNRIKLTGGGNSNAYKIKYLKYKNKYLKLKNKLNK